MAEESAVASPTPSYEDIFKQFLVAGGNAVIDRHAGVQEQSAPTRQPYDAGYTQTPVGTSQPNASITDSAMTFVSDYQTQLIYGFGGLLIGALAWKAFRG